MRKRSFRRTLRRGPRAPVLWERFFTTIATGAGSTAPNEILLSAPGSFEPNVVDSNWTLRTLRLNLCYKYVFTILVANDAPLATFGLYRKDINDPVIADSSAPTTQDWLDLWTIQYFTPLAGDLVASPLSMQSASATRVVRAMRKLDQQEGIFLTSTCFHFTVAQSVAFSSHAAMQVSNLWSRTPKR